MNNTATKKTVYDPSMTGFVLPKTAAFTGFTYTGGNTSNSNELNVSGSFNKGWNYYTNGWKSGGLFFMIAPGYRDTASSRTTGLGLILDVGNVADFWNVGASSYIKARGLGFIKTVTNPQGEYFRSYGYCIYVILD